MTTELLDAPTKSEVAAYQPFYADLAKLEEDNQKVVFDYESPKGNKEARSHVYKLRQTKGALEKTRVEAKAESVRIGRAVDAEAKEINVRIEAMIVVHQAKIDEIEQREADRVGSLHARIAELGLVGIDAQTSIELRVAITQLEAVAIDDSWQELATNAAKAKDAHLQNLRNVLTNTEKQEAEAAELARLRAEALAREQADRDAAIAAAAVAKAQAAAKELAEAESRKAAQDIANAEAKAKAEREAADRRELELKLAAENAERRRVESEQKAAQDAKDAEVRAEQSRLKAIQDEKDRVAAAEKAEAAAQAKREANKAHLAKINRAAVAALVKGGVDEDVAKLVVTLIAKGEVPAVSINY